MAVLCQEMLAFMENDRLLVNSGHSLLLQSKDTVAVTKVFFCTGCILTVGMNQAGQQQPGFKSLKRQETAQVQHVSQCVPLHW